MKTGSHFTIKYRNKREVTFINHHYQWRNTLLTEESMMKITKTKTSREIESAKLKRNETLVLEQSNGKEHLTRT